MITDNPMDSDKRYIYYYDVCKQRKDSNGEFVAPISIVFENVSGHYPTGSGGNGSQPWYWTQKHCDLQNEEMGYTLLEAMKLLDTSMFA